MLKTMFYIKNVPVWERVLRDGYWTDTRSICFTRAASDVHFHP